MVSSQGSEGDRLMGLHVQSVSKGFIQILTDNISEVCRGTIMLEPDFTKAPLPAARVGFLHKC
jgi:hypothetical protein